MAIVNVRMDEDLVGDIDAFADKNGLSRSQAVRILCGAALGQAPYDQAARETAMVLYRAQTIGINKFLEKIQKDLPGLIRKELQG